MNADDVTKEHVRRTQLPWRVDEGKTECGLAAAKFTTISYLDLHDKIKDQGQARAAMSTCMTCWQTAERYQGTWANQRREFREPSLPQVLSRELTKFAYGEPRDPELRHLRFELEALAQMANMDRQTFESIVAELEATVNIKDIVRKPKTAAPKAMWE